MYVNKHPSEPQSQQVTCVNSKDQTQQLFEKVAIFYAVLYPPDREVGRLAVRWDGGIEFNLWFSRTKQLLLLLSSSSPSSLSLLKMASSNLLEINTHVVVSAHSGEER